MLRFMVKNSVPQQRQFDYKCPPPKNLKIWQPYCSANSEDSTLQKRIIPCCHQTESTTSAYYNSVRHHSTVEGVVFISYTSLKANRLLLLRHVTRTIISDTPTCTNHYALELRLPLWDQVLSRSVCRLFLLTQALLRVVLWVPYGNSWPPPGSRLQALSTRPHC